MKLRWWVPLLAIAIAWLAILISCVATRDPEPTLEPMALEPLTPAEYAKRAARASLVLVARLEQIDEAPEYTPPCGIFLRIKHDCPALTYRMKLRTDHGAAMWALFQIPWEGFMPLREGTYATFFLHERYFETCRGAGPYMQCRFDKWLALNEPKDVAAP